MTEKNVAVGRYVIMPDHVHLFVSGNAEFNLGLWIRGLKRALATGLTDPGTNRLWQPGFFDHRLRSNESYTAKWDYVHQNPVRVGLVMRAEDWRYQGEVVAIDRV